MVGLNNDIWGGWKHVTVQTSFGPNVYLHDYSGHTGDVWTDGHGMASIAIPPNDNGAGYCCFSRAGLDKPNRHGSWSTTQLFEGAPDLITPPATKEGSLVGGIWCAAGTQVQLKPNSKVLLFEVKDAAGDMLIPRGTAFEANTTHSGAHTITAFSTADPTPYKLLVTYTAPQTLEGI